MSNKRGSGPLQSIQNIRESTLTNLLAVVLAPLFVLEFNRYYASGSSFSGGSVVNIALFVVFVLLFRRTLRTGASAKKYGFGFALVLSAAMVIGKYLYVDDTIGYMFHSLENFLSTLLSILGFTLFWGLIFSIVFDYLLRKDAPLCGETALWKLFAHKRAFFILWAILFIAWIPCYLSYYPGVYSYDLYSQTGQALGIYAYSRFHPPLHTFLWQLCLELEKLLGVSASAIVIYSIGQMLCMSAAFAALVHYLIRRRMRNGVILFALLFFALCPTVAIFSFIATKDMAFAIVFVLFTIELTELVRSPEEYLKAVPKMLKFALLIVLCCLFRNNAVYALLLFSPFLIVTLRRHWTRVLSCLAAACIAYLMISGPIYSLLGVGGGSAKEALCVPMQQIATVAVKEADSLSQEDKDRISRYMNFDEIADKYNPRFADFIKGLFNNNAFLENKGDFIGLWLNLLARYPGRYIDAFLDLHLPYWYPDSNAVDEHSQRDYIETYILSNDRYMFERQSKIPWLYDWYESAASFELFEGVPVISNLFSLSLPLWAMLLTMFVLFLKKKRKLVLTLLPSLLILLTFMAGPVSNYRYIFPIFVLYPFFLALLLQPGRLLDPASAPPAFGDAGVSILPEAPQPAEE